MADQKAKDLDHTKREQARRELSTEFERLQESLKPVNEAFKKVKEANFDDDMAARLATLADAVKRAINGGLFKGGVGSHSRAREEWLKVKGK
jgi:hypothetical protein